MSNTPTVGVTLMARNSGLTNEEYLARRAAGEKYCMTCAAWHPVSDFGSDRSRYDGLSPKCKKRRNAENRERYARKGDPLTTRHRLC